MRKWLADLAKWIVIIIFAAVLFYLVCPKYHFEFVSVNSYDSSGRPEYTRVTPTRCNKITGKMERAELSPSKSASSQISDD